MNNADVSPAVYTSVESVMNAIPDQRSDKIPKSEFQHYVGATAYPPTRMSLAELGNQFTVIESPRFHGVKQRHVMFSQKTGVRI